MLSSFPIALLMGTVFGFLAGLGVGGGSLLVLWLTAILQVPQQTARCINLMFFIPAALISTLFRNKQYRLNYATILPAIIAGCISAIIISRLSVALDIATLKRLFGLLLVITGLRELFYRPRKAR